MTEPETNAAAREATARTDEIGRSRHGAVPPPWEGGGWGRGEGRGASPEGENSTGQTRASSQIDGGDATSSPAAPLLSGVVVHWRNEDLLEELASAWPRDPRFELVVVDNGSRRPLDLPAGVRRIAPGRNLGFAGGANAGAALARAPIVLFLNPDAVPEPGALDALLQGFATLPDAAGLAPRLVGLSGEPQFTWHLRRLPAAWEIALQGLFLPFPRPLAMEPAAGATVAQPAAAALALRRAALDRIGGGGFDAGFFPAWFEDVDLARRLAQAGLALRYWPAARVRHALGSTVAELGYGPFLWIYGRNLVRYLGKHHGPAWAGAGRAGLALGAALRLAALPLRRPRRAPSRAAAARGLLAALAGALSGWRRPAALASLGTPAPGATDAPAPAIPAPALASPDAPAPPLPAEKGRV